MGNVKPIKTKYRTIFISDLHLGTKRSRADLLLHFLKHTESDTLYLVGDIIDNWALKRTWFWEQSHNDVIQKILRKARKGTKVVFIPGNHDEVFRDFTKQSFGGIRVKLNDIHTTADGKKYLVMHGDEFDGVVLYAKWLAYLGDRAYEIAVNLNHYFNKIRRFFRLPYWSLSAFLKRRVKRAVEFIGNFEDAVVRKAHSKGVHGVICGHIHTPEMRMIDGIHYCNDGDWVETCSALVEHGDGRFELLDWTKFQDSESVEEDESEAVDDSDGRLVSAS
ncbi:MAG: UDP-2,3-diacylglucosamine diphosphatase [Pseudomonadota bacterium]